MNGYTQTLAAAIVKFGREMQEIAAMGTETIWMNYQPVIQMSLVLEGKNRVDDV